VPKPDFEVACASWIYAGGAHHTGFSQQVTTEMLEDFAGMSGIELVVIDADTKVRQLRQELEWNEVAYGLKHGFLA
jgi:L-arabinose isomerase